MAGWGRVRCIVSPSAPQRCSSESLVALHELAAEFGVPFHIHVQESRGIQAMSGGPLYGKSMVNYLADLGVLDEYTTIAHGVWLDERDVGLIADAGTAVVHNPASNLKLGSGIARASSSTPGRHPRPLGTDANTCNDGQSMFEAMKLAALLSCAASADPSDWLNPAMSLRWPPSTGTWLDDGRESGGYAKVKRPTW